MGDCYVWYRTPILLGLVLGQLLLGLVLGQLLLDIVTFAIELNGIEFCISDLTYVETAYKILMK